MSTTTNNTDSVRKKYKKRSPIGEVFYRLKRNKGAILGATVILVLMLLAIFADVIYDYDTDIVGQNPKERFIHPCWEHPFGTDNLGRDQLARIIYGTRASLPVGFVAVLVALALGMVTGAFAGFFGGKVENVIMRVMDVFSAVPNTLLAIALVAVMGTSTFSLMVALGVASMPGFARITRAAVLSVRNQEYVESARAIGCTSPEIIFQHIIPNCLSPIIVQCTLRMGSAIISASSLSYLGLGVPAPMPEWGSLLSAGRNYIRDHSYLTMFPGLAIMITVIAFNLLGDGLRDSMDPKLKK
jgi:peptide/nickel transport system permease protein